jgi:AraC-like DNA-binding protein
MTRFTMERFVASGSDCPLVVPYFRGRHDLEAGVRCWVSNRQRIPGMALLQYLEVGSMQVRWQGRMLLVHAPALVLTAFGEDSTYGSEDTAQEGYRSIWLNADGHGLAALCHHLRAQHGPAWPDPHGILAARLRPLLAPTALNLPIAALARLCAELFITLHEQRDAPPPSGAAARALAVLEADPFQPWRLEQVAADNGCSRAQLFRLARQRWGMSAKRWLDRQRLLRAEQLLHQGGQRVAEVARLVGYRSPQVLNRHLRALRGTIRRTRG